MDDRALADLKRLVALLQNPTYQNRSLLLFGFADSYGGTRSNSIISTQRAQAVAEQLRRQGIVPSLVKGYGNALPIASNDTEDGREQNRRVEVWLH
jgi:phosphate transport system substrate-binding protein